MLLSRDNCSTCMNNTHGTSACCYQSQYVDALAALDEFLDRYKPVTEWFGCLRATCDYYVKDTSRDLGTCCCPPSYTWKDIVRIPCGPTHIYLMEEFPITGHKDDDQHYQIDEFITAVGQKHLVDPDSVQCYMLDQFELPDPCSLDPAVCGCYINGKPEWVD